ncbi:MAG: hypothetical protein F4Y03_17505 [Alphaproteobacteria bacterium]|nr:hypothetical protein [Alphaproteobacteria bacterium]
MIEGTPQIPESERFAPERDLRREEFDLKQEEAYRSLLGDYHRQIIRFRLYTIVFASIIVALLCCLVVWSLLWGPLARISENGVALNVALIVAPIVAVTTITVFVLIGVFRGFRDKDMDNIPVQTMLRTAGGQES